MTVPRESSRNCCRDPPVRTLKPPGHLGTGRAVSSSAVLDFFLGAAAIADDGLWF